MYSLSEAAWSDKPLAEIFTDVAALVPAGWEYPELIRARIVFDGRQHVAPPFQPTDWKLSSDIVLAGDARGQLEVYYLQQPPDADDGAFSGEQRSFVDAIAGVLAQTAEKKLTEEALWLRSSIIDHTIEGVIAGDLQGNIIFVNEQMAGMHGYEVEELIGKNISVFHTPEQMSGVELNGRQLMATGRFTGETSHVRRDGSVFPAMMRISLLRDDSGEPMGVIGTCMDITDHQQAEADAREQATRLNQTFMDSMPCVAMLIRPHTHEIVACNETAKKAGCVVGKTCYSTWGQRESPCPWCLAPELWSTGKPQHREYEALGAVSDANWCPLADDLYLYYAFDITDRRRAEDELRVHAQITASMTEGVSLVRVKDGVLLYTNPRFEEMFGYGRDEMLGRHVSIVNAPTDKTPEGAAEEIMASQAEHGVWRGEIKNIRKDGTSFWCYASVSVFDHPQHGEVLVTVQSDITERKQAEAEVVNLANFPAENPAPVLRVTPDGHVLYTNVAAQEMPLGGQGGELTRTFPRWLPILAKAMESGEQHELEEQLGKRVLSFVFAPVVEAGYVNIYGRDITERKRAEEEVVSLAKFPAENRNPVLRVTSDGHVLYTNAAAEEMPLGGQGGELTRTFPRWLPVLAKAMESGEQHELEEQLGQRVLSFVFAPVVEAGYVNIYGRDITERKLAEEALLTERRRLRALAGELSVAEDMERQRISSALHEEVSQELAAAKIKIGLLARSMPSPEHAESLDEVFQTIDRTLQDVTSLTFQLCPPVLYRQGLAAALKWLVEEFDSRHDESFEFVDQDISLPVTDEVRGLMFQVVRELLTNVVKHAQAKRVTLAAQAGRDEVKITVTDDGVGFDTVPAVRADDETSGFGLFSIRQRIGYFGGRLDIQPAAQGSRITVTMPLVSKDQSRGEGYGYPNPVG